MKKENWRAARWTWMMDWCESNNLDCRVAENWDKAAAQWAFAHSMAKDNKCGN